MTAGRLRAGALPALAAAVVIVVALLVRTGAPAAETTAAAHSVRSGHVTVAITNFAFSPAKLTVKAGTRVTFVNHDATAHTATADHGGFGTGTINPKHRSTVRLARPGTYPYHCLFHAFMTGSIKVVK